MDHLGQRRWIWFVEDDGGDGFGSLDTMVVMTVAKGASTRYDYGGGRCW